MNFTLTCIRNFVVANNFGYFHFFIAHFISESCHWRFFFFCLFRCRCWNSQLRRPKWNQRRCWHTASHYRLAHHNWFTTAAAAHHTAVASVCRYIGSLYVFILPPFSAAWHNILNFLFPRTSVVAFQRQSCFKRFGILLGVPILFTITAKLWVIHSWKFQLSVLIFSILKNSFTNFVLVQNFWALSISICNMCISPFEEWL